MTDINHPTDLSRFLTQRVRDSGVPQKTLAQRTGYSQKHISSMLCMGAGSIQGWDNLLRAAGIAL